MPNESFRETQLRYNRRVRLNEVFVQFSITSRSKTALEISRELELTPSFFSDKGEEFPELELVADSTIWTLRTEDFINSQDVSDHLNWLVSRLFGRGPALRRFQRSGVSMKIDIMQYIWTDSFSFSPNSETLEFFSKYGIQLNFIQTFYSGNPDQYSVYRKR